MWWSDHVSSNGAKGGTAHASEERIASAASMAWYGSTHEAIANELGVARKTVSRWAQSDAWKRAQADLAAQVAKRVQGKLAGLADSAVDGLRKVLEKGTEKDADLIRAAVAVLDRLGVGPHATQHHDVVEEVSPDDVDAEVEKLRNELGLTGVEDEA